ncbi:hypothetical protein AB9M10_14595 [Rhodococcus erythropolis]
MPPEGPTVIRRDGRPPQQNPANQAWSQVPPEAPQQPRREDWAPTQRPQPFQDDPPQAGAAASGSAPPGEVRTRAAAPNPAERPASPS